MTKSGAVTAKDVMASPVVTAEAWQTLYELRRTLLTGVYSALPWKNGDSWHLVTSDWLVDQIRALRKEKHWIRQILAKAAEKNMPPSHDPICPDKPFCCLKPETTLIVENGNAVGILAPTDFLAAVRALGN